MSLPIEAVDRIFTRLAATYMASWDRAIGNTPLMDVKTAWAHELSAFGASRKTLRRIAWALDNLPDRAPNPIEFRKLCMSAPAEADEVLAAPKADPERVAREIAKLGPLRAKPAERTDMKDWARRIVARHAAGDKINPTSLLFARQALRFQPETEAA
jgi:hypothetical protein